MKRLAKAHQDMRRARADVHHTTALALVRQDDTIAHDAVQPAHLLRTPPPPRATSLSAAGGRAFLSLRSCLATR